MELSFSGTPEEYATVFPNASALLLTRLSEVSQTLAVIGLQQEQIMASVQDVLDAAAAERAEVAGRLTELEAVIQALRDQVAAGAAATPEQLDELVVAVQNIFTRPPDVPVTT